MYKEKHAMCQVHTTLPQIVKLARIVSEPTFVASNDFNNNSRLKGVGASFFFTERHFR